MTTYQFEQREFSAATVTPQGFSHAALMQLGEIKGHGMTADKRTLETLLVALNEKETLPAYLTHAGTGKDRLGTEIGIWSAPFYLDGDKVRARSFAFLEAFIKNSPKEHQSLVELAQKAPNEFGVSIVCTCGGVWVLSTGEEIDVEGPRPFEATHELPAMRIGSVQSADLVKHPAATNGLFAAPIEKVTTAEAALAEGQREAFAALTSARVEMAVYREKITTLEAKLKEAECYDIRKSGAPAMCVVGHSFDGDVHAPREGATDQEKWEQHHALAQTNPKAAARFLSTYLRPKTH